MLLTQHAVEQLQWRRGAGERLPRQVEIAHGGRYVAMAEQALNGVDVDPGFQQMRGETVAQGVDAAGPSQAGAIACRAINARRCLGIDRPAVRGVGEQL